MAMQAVYLKEHDGILRSPTGQFSSVPPALWWTASAAQPLNGDSFGQSSTSPVEQASCGNPVSAAKQASQEQGSDKESLTQFTIFSGDCKNLVDEQKNRMAASPLPEYCSRFELGLAQPMICAKYPYVEQCYGVYPYGHPMPGRIMLPLNLATDDGPIYVNAKQYDAIIRRRKLRAKAEMQNKCPKVRKQYMHESRHKHAMRRPRGSGGRFLNTRNLNSQKEGSEKKDYDGQSFPPTGSQSSEVLQSDSGTLNSSKETNSAVANYSGSEVTSMYSREDLDRFPMDHLRSSVQSYSGMIDTGHSIVMPSKWVMATDSCHNLAG